MFELLAINKLNQKKDFYSQNSLFIAIKFPEILIYDFDIVDRTL